RDRGYLAIVLCELVLAQRPGVVQRDERRGHRALGHQSQARQHAALSAARREGPTWRRLLLSRQRQLVRGGRAERARRDGARFPPRAGPGLDTRLCRIWRT